MKRTLSLVGALSLLATLQACVAIPEYSSGYAYDYPVYYPSTTVYSGWYYSPSYYSYSRPPAPQLRPLPPHSHPHQPVHRPHIKDKPQRPPPPSAHHPSPKPGPDASPRPPRPDASPRPPRPDSGPRPDASRHPPRPEAGSRPRLERPQAERRPASTEGRGRSG